MRQGLRQRAVRAIRRFYRNVTTISRIQRPPKLVALTATRNEDWVLGFSLRVSLSYCDAVIITDHGSTDRTAQIISEARAEFPNRVIDVRRLEQQEWREAEVRQEMLERGRRWGGTHFVIVDADEVPTANLLSQLRSLALKIEPGGCAALPMIAPYLSPSVYRLDGPWGEQSAIPWVFGDSPELGWQCAESYQIHRRAPFGAINQGLLLPARGQGGLFHLQFVDKNRLQSKAAWYKMMETVDYPGQRSAADLNQLYDWPLQDDSTAKIETVPESWWAAYRECGWLRFFAPNAPAWQSDEARRLASLHGRERFAGLDLHGII